MTISKCETLSLKGLAIVMIVLHNVVHVISPVGENEFAFDAGNLSEMMHLFWSKPVEVSLSFFGWLGVSVFVFVSGYGLTEKYGERTFFPSTASWIGKHYRKLFLLLLPAYIGFLILLRAWNHPDFYSLPKIILQQLLLLNIFDPASIRPGVYWYLGLALQLYLCFVVMRRWRLSYLIGVGVVCALAIGFLPDKMVFYLRHNCIGWMPEFVMGIVIARLKMSETTRCTEILVAAIALCLVVLCQFSASTFALSGCCFVGFMLTVRAMIFRLSGLVWLGGLSASLYVIHPLVRYAWLFTVDKLSLPVSAVCSAIVVFIISIIGAIIYRAIFPVSSDRNSRN